MLKRLNAAKWYLLVGLITYIVFLVANFPVSIAVNGLQKIVPQLPVSISKATGTLWNAEATISQAIVGPTHVQWSLQASSLLTGVAVLNLYAKNAKAEITTTLALSNQQMVLNNTKGTIYPPLINLFIRDQHASMQGDISIDQLDLVINRSPLSAGESRGQIVWQGGDVKYKSGNKHKTTTLPMIIGKISDDSGQLTMKFHEEDGTQVASAFIKPDGWAGAKIKRRLVDLIGEKVPGNSSPDTNIFELSEKIF